MGDHIGLPSEFHESHALAAFQGMLSGGLGTVPMTAAMVALQQLLPTREQDPLPPRLIVEDITAEMDLDDSLSSEAVESLAWVSHVGYGSLMGAVYGLLARRPIWQGVAGGMAFGMAAWFGSYLGWLPAFNMRASATNETARRNAMIIAAHLIWGGTMGYVQEIQQAAEER